MPRYIARAIYLGPYNSDEYSHRYVNARNLEEAISMANSNIQKKFWDSWPDDLGLPSSCIVEVRVKRVGKRYKWHNAWGNFNKSLRFQREGEREEFEEYSKRRRNKT